MRCSSSFPFVGVVVLVASAALQACNCGGPQPECTDSSQCQPIHGAPACGAWACNAGVCEVECPGCTDNDKDGFGVETTPGACAGPDCDDTDKTIHDTGSRSCYSGRAGTAGVGVCVAGSQTCSAGTWTACQGEVLPAGVEACNGRDDTCDGTTDEGIPSITCGIGACQRTVAGCADGGTPACTPGVPATDDSVCNGIDDDCDGPIDEDCVLGCVRVDSTGGNDSTGASSDGGTPFATIQAAVDFASARNDPNNGGKNVCVAVTGAACPTTTGTGTTRTYTTTGPLTMRDGISVLGGYTSAGWTRCNTAFVDTRINPGDARGVLFGTGITNPTVLDGFTVLRQTAGTTMAGVTVAGARGAVITNVSIPVNTTTTYAYGVNVLDGGSATITNSSILGGDGTLETIGVRAVGSQVTLRNNCAAYDAGMCDLTGVVNGCLAGNGVRGRLGSASVVAESYAVLLQDAVGSSLETSSICANRGQEGAAIRIKGSGDQVVIRGNSIIGAGGTVDSHGIWAEDCGGKAPRISGNTVIAAQGAGGLVPPPRSEGVHSVGDCHPVIDSNKAISGAAEGQTNNAFGVFCGANAGGVASKCDVLDNAAIGGSSGGFPPISAAVWCQNGSCNRVQGNLLVGGQSGQDSYGLWLQNTGATVERNQVIGGTCTPRGTGIYAENAFARVTNNRVLGAAPPPPGGTCNRGNQRSLGIQVVNAAGANEVDIHSNSVSGGGTALSTTCASAALAIASGTPDGGQPPAAGGKGVYRNNILRAGDCPIRYDVWELDAGADPRVFQNNDLDPYTTGVPTTSTVLYLDEGGNAINLVGSVNGATDMTASGNISADPFFRNYAGGDWHLDAGSPCINQGTATGAPALDFDGDPRDATPDIGFDEFK